MCLSEEYWWKDPFSYSALINRDRPLLDTLDDFIEAGFERTKYHRLWKGAGRFEVSKRYKYEMDFRMWNSRFKLLLLEINKDVDYAPVARFGGLPFYTMIPGVGRSDDN